MESSTVDTDLDWMEFFCKSGELLFYYNKVTAEHRWPDGCTNSYESGTPIYGRPLICVGTQTEDYGCSNGCASVHVDDGLIQPNHVEKENNPSASSSQVEMNEDVLLASGESGNTVPDNAILPKSPVEDTSALIWQSFKQMGDYDAYHNDIVISQDNNSSSTSASPHFFPSTSGMVLHSNGEDTVFKEHSPSINIHPFTSYPQQGSHEVKENIERKRPRVKGKDVYGPTRGSALFDSHMSIGWVFGDGLPKFGEHGWPPPFRRTVEVMREFLENHCGTAILWTNSAFGYQKAYFNRVLHLHGTATSSGNIYLYYKVSELSDRSWKVANTIMDKIENGSLIRRKKKQNTARKYCVVQTSFRCLTGKDPIKDEQKIYETLVEYENGTLPEEINGATKKARQINEQSGSNNGLSIAKLVELNKKLEDADKVKNAAESENKELKKVIERLRNDLSQSKEETLALSRELNAVKDENSKLSQSYENATPMYGRPLICVGTQTEDYGCGNGCASVHVDDGLIQPMSRR